MDISHTTQMQIFAVRHRQIPKQGLVSAVIIAETGLKAIEGFEVVNKRNPNEPDFKPTEELEVLSLGSVGENWFSLQDQLLMIEAGDCVIPWLVVCNIKPKDPKSDPEYPIQQLLRYVERDNKVRWEDLRAVVADASKSDPTPITTGFPTTPSFYDLFDSKDLVWIKDIAKQGKVLMIEFGTTKRSRGLPHYSVLIQPQDPERAYQLLAKRLRNAWL